MSTAHRHLPGSNAAVGAEARLREAGLRKTPVRLSVLELLQRNGNTWSGSIEPQGAGPWGVTVRALPTHPGLSSVYDTGLVASG